MMNQKSIGVVAILLGSLMWAFEIVIAKFAYVQSSYSETAVIRAGIVTIIALIYAVITKGDFKVTKVQITALGYIALGGCLLAEWLYLYAVQKTSIVNVILLVHFQPLFILLFGYFFLKEEKLNVWDYTGIALMLIAASIVTIGTVENIKELRLTSIGDLMVIGSAAIFSTTAIVAKKYLKGLNVGVLVFYRYSMALIVLFAYVVMYSNIRISSIYQPLLGLFTGLGILFYYEGLKRVKVAQIGGLELSSVLFAAALGWILLGQPITSFQIMGMVAIGGGVYCISRKGQV